MKWPNQYASPSFYSPILGSSDIELGKEKIEREFESTTIADGEESSMEEINESASLGDNSEMGTNDTSSQTGMLVVKKEDKEYATAINTTACGHFQN